MMRIRYRLAALAVIMILAVLVSGCLGARAPAASPAEPPGVLLDYQRTGGIAGTNDRLVIFDNGIALVATRQSNIETTINKTDLDRIDTLFSAAGFVSLEGNYTSQRNVADILHYRISYHGKTVNTEDTAVPPGLEPVIMELNRILASYSSSSTGPYLPVIISP